MLFSHNHWKNFKKATFSAHLFWKLSCIAATDAFLKLEAWRNILLAASMGSRLKSKESRGRREELGSKQCIWEHRCSPSKRWCRQVEDRRGLADLILWANKHNLFLYALSRLVQGRPETQGCFGHVLKYLFNNNLTTIKTASWFSISNHRVVY